MNMSNENKKRSFFKKNYRGTNLLVSIFAFFICIFVVFYNKSNNIFWSVIFPLIICFIVILVLSILTDIFIRILIKKSKNKAIKKINDELALENPNMNMYPVNPKLYEIGLTIEQYDRLKKFRVSNLLVCVIIALILIICLVDFDGYIFTQIFLPIIMIIGSVGVLGTFFDFIAEKIIKKSYKKHPNKIKNKKKAKQNIFTKNRRIYYVPIYIILGIMITLIIVDFNRKDKIISRVVLPCEIITILDFIFMLITDYIIDRFNKLKKLLNQDDDIFSYSMDELDIYSLEDGGKEDEI